MKEVEGDKSKGGTGTGTGSYVDPNLPRWQCQMCRHPLSVTGAEAYAEKFASESYRSGVHASSIHGTASVLGTSRMDHSFVILSKQKNQAPGFPPRPRPSGIQNPGSSPTADPHHPVNHALGHSDKSFPGHAANMGSDIHGTKAMDESFVVLPSAAASMYRYDSSPEGSGVHSPSSVGSSSSALHTNNATFNSSITVLNRVFDIVSTQTQLYWCQVLLEIYCFMLNFSIYMLPFFLGNLSFRFVQERPQIWVRFVWLGFGQGVSNSLWVCPGRTWANPDESCVSVEIKWHLKIF